MAGRTLDIMIGANERQQFDSRRPGDVMITVPMGDIGSASFDKVAEAIPLGRAAALEHREELSRYSLPRDEYDAWCASVTRGEPAAVKIAGVRVEGAVRVNPDYVREALRLEAGDVVTPKTIERHVNHAGRRLPAHLDQFAGRVFGTNADLRAARPRGLVRERRLVRRRRGLPAARGHGFVRAAGGSSLGSALPAYDQFLLGGPLTLTLAGTSEGDWQIMFDLGRPIQEHTIMDPVR